MKIIKFFKIILIISTSLVFMGALGGPVAEKVREGNELFRLNKYSEALDSYNTALAFSPENTVILFNIGDTLFHQKKYDEAIEHFRKVISTAKDDDIKEKSYYNIGNALFMQGTEASSIEKLSEAIESYKKALELDPNDKDAKYNLEVARKHLEIKKDDQKNQENQQKQKNGSPQDKSDEKEQTDSGDSQDKNDQKDQQEQNQQQQSNTSEMDKATPEKKLDQPPEPAKEGKISRKEAEKLLQALEDEEKDAMKQRFQNTSEPGFVGKDW